MTCAIYSFSQNILEAAIVEKDSQIAELEVCGVLDEADTRRCDSLKLDRDELLNRLKVEVSPCYKYAQILLDFSEMT